MTIADEMYAQINEMVEKGDTRDWDIIADEVIENRNVDEQKNGNSLDTMDEKRELEARKINDEIAKEMAGNASLDYDTLLSKKLDEYMKKDPSKGPSWRSSVQSKAEIIGLEERNAQQTQDNVNDAFRNIFDDINKPIDDEANRTQAIEDKPMKAILDNMNERIAAGTDPVVAKQEALGQHYADNFITDSKAQAEIEKKFDAYRKRLEDEELAALVKQIDEQVGLGKPLDKAEREVIAKHLEGKNKAVWATKTPEEQAAEIAAMKEKIDTYKKEAAEAGKGSKTDSKTDDKSGVKKYRSGLAAQISNFLSKPKNIAKAAVAGVALGGGALGIASGVLYGMGAGGLGLVPVFTIAGMGSFMIPPIIGGIAAGAAATYIVKKLHDRYKAKKADGKTETKAEKPKFNERLANFFKGKGR